MPKEYRPVQQIPFELLCNDCREKYGIQTERDGFTARLIGKDGTLSAIEVATGFLHPERLLTTMTEREASSQKKNLERSVSFHRIAYEKTMLARSANGIGDKADAGLE